MERTDKLGPARNIGLGTVLAPNICLPTYRSPCELSPSLMQVTSGFPVLYSGQQLPSFTNVFESEFQQTLCPGTPVA